MARYAVVSWPDGRRERIEVREPRATDGGGMGWDLFQWLGHAAVDAATASGALHLSPAKKSRLDHAIDLAGGAVTTAIGQNDLGKAALSVGRVVEGVIDYVGEHDPIGHFAAAIGRGEDFGQAWDESASLVGHVVDDLGPYAQMAASLFPGVGTGVAAAIGVAMQIAHGANGGKAILDALKAAVPGGTITTAAIYAGDAAVNAALRGERIDRALLETARGAIVGRSGESAGVLFDLGTALAISRRVRAGGAAGAAAKTAATRAAPQEVAAAAAHPVPTPEAVEVAGLVTARARKLHLSPAATQAAIAHAMGTAPPPRSRARDLLVVAAAAGLVAAGVHAARSRRR